MEGLPIGSKRPHAATTAGSNSGSNDDSSNPAAAGGAFYRESREQLLDSMAQQQAEGVAKRQQMAVQCMALAEQIGGLKAEIKQVQQQGQQQIQLAVYQLREELQKKHAEELAAAEAAAAEKLREADEEVRSLEEVAAELGRKLVQLSEECAALEQERLQLVAGAAAQLGRLCGSGGDSGLSQQRGGASSGSPATPPAAADLPATPKQSSMQDLGTLLARLLRQSEGRGVQLPAEADIVAGALVSQVQTTLSPGSQAQLTPGQLGPLANLLVATLGEELGRRAANPAHGCAAAAAESPAVMNAVRCGAADATVAQLELAAGNVGTAVAAGTAGSQAKGTAADGGGGAGHMQCNLATHFDAVA